MCDGILHLSLVCVHCFSGALHGDCRGVNLEYSTEFLGSWRFLGSWLNKSKQLVHGKNCFVLLLSLVVMLRLSRSLRVSATQDTDKPEIQPVSEPESLHSCVLFCVRVGQA